MAEQQQAPVVAEQAQRRSSTGKTIASVVLVIVLITLGFYGVSWATSDIGKQRVSEFFSTVSTKYNPFSWYGEKLKEAGEIGRIWETESNVTAEEIGIKFKSVEAVGSKIVPSGTPLAFRYKLDVGEGVREVPLELECNVKDKSSEFTLEEELIESKKFRPSNRMIYL